jgi:hypothetical protein
MLPRKAMELWGTSPFAYPTQKKGSIMLSTKTGIFSCVVFCVPHVGIYSHQ